MLEVRLEPTRGLGGDGPTEEPAGLRQSIREAIVGHLQSVECPNGCRRPYLTVIVVADWQNGRVATETIQACCLAHAAIATDRLGSLMPCHSTSTDRTITTGAYLS